MIRILIVDSDASCRAIVRNALTEGLSAAVTECPDGGAALEALSRTGIPSWSPSCSCR